MSPSSASRPQTMKTREISSYASNYMTQTPHNAGLDNSIVNSVETTEQIHSREPSEFLPVDTQSIATRTAPLSGKNAVAQRRSQSNEPKAQKRKSKNASPTLLTKSLSEIAHESPHIVVTDVSAFANRSVEARRLEAEKAAKVKRPLNAFMLYRKAYQNVAKTQCSRNNHQQVSTICGSSWNSWEPQGVIAHFKQLASIEKQMHESAFPAYKYDPVQTKKLKDSTSQNPTTLCDLSDGESTCRRRRSGRQRAVRSMSRMRQAFTMDGPAQHAFPPVPPPPQSYPPPGFAELYAYGGGLPTDLNHYVARGVTQHQQGGNDPVGNAPYGGTYSDLPVQPCYPFFESCLDPSLQAEAPPSEYGQLLGDNQDWMNVRGPGNAAVHYVPDLAGGAHNAYLQGGPGDWYSRQLEDGSDLNEWITQTENGA